MPPLKICLVASEVTPFAKTGGLADVAAGLARALHDAGHDVRLVMPFYPRVRAKAETIEPATATTTLSLGSREIEVGFARTTLPNSPVPVHLVDCPELFDRDELYGGKDEHVRFAALSRAALTACQVWQWSPDVLHCNDWHTALIPLLLKLDFAWDRLFEGTRTVLTIHNIGYQGQFPSEELEALGWKDQGHLLHREDLEDGRINFLKTGLLYADAITTVSRTYAEEIQTSEFGAGLEDLLTARRDSLRGIVNGVDYGDWNPASDPHLPHPYDAEDLSGKAAMKRALLERFELDTDGPAPTLGIVSRMTGQKGFEVLPDALAVLLKQYAVRLVVLGSGEAKYESYFQWLRDNFPTRVGVYFGYNEELAHWIEAGSDLFVMPSRYEPCGLNQMYSLRYGTIPIVRRTGGLADTVREFDPYSGEGTGFTFQDFTSEAFFQATKRALDTFMKPQLWRRLIANGMGEDFSWKARVPEYVELYRELLTSSPTR